MSLSLDFNNPVSKAFLFHSSVLIAKTLAMELLVHWHTVICKLKHRSNNLHRKIRHVEKVQRIKRAHLNDIENIPIFVAIAFAYTLTEPDADTATKLFRIFTIVRFAHTLVYAVYVIPQPARAVAFIVGEIVTWYMIIRVFLHFFYNC